MTPLPHLCYPQWHGDISILPALSTVFLENILGELWLVLTLSLHLQLESSGCDNTSRTHSVSIKIQEGVKQNEKKRISIFWIFTPLPHILWKKIWSIKYISLIDPRVLLISYFIFNQYRNEKIYFFPHQKFFIIFLDVRGIRSNSNVFSVADIWWYREQK